MTREQARTYLKCSGMSEEQIDTVEKAFTGVTPTEMKSYIDNCGNIFTYPTERTGHWVHKNDDYFDWFECSECGYGSEGEVNYGSGFNFCPNCGADMRGENE